MSIRAVALVVLAVLACGVAESAPRTKTRKRTGPFAEFIDPAAPEDPPVPWKSGPTWLAVVFLIDRAVSDGADLGALKTAAQNAHQALEDRDAAAILAFDTSVEPVLRPEIAAKERKKVTQALARVTQRVDSDLPAALDGARGYIATAPDRKVIIVFTGARNMDDRFRAAIAAVRSAQIELMFVVPGQDAAQALTFKPALPVYALDRRDSLRWLEDTISALHYWR